MSIKLCNMITENSLPNISRATLKDGIPYLNILNLNAGILFLEIEILLKKLLRVTSKVFRYIVDIVRNEFKEGFLKKPQNSYNSLEHVSTPLLQSILHSKTSIAFS